ncbi:NlpC/P60 family protein [Rathayibacter toxicus]|uniref:C40 family peptidase n=1 Tax=Rathayibacter toxicus TaxID=145458 RepID=UPI0006986EAC|nr:NlpC/P60 family protein [Rathayibacter toxicus]
MADHHKTAESFTPAPRERAWNGRLPLAITAAFTVTAVTASLGIAPASADDPHYPSWDDVQNAKADEATKRAEIDSITGLIARLQTTVDTAAVTAMQKAEAWRQAKEALDEAAQKVADLKEKTNAASAKAQTSKMRAGLLAAHLSRAAGSDLSTSLVAKGENAGDLLYQLSAMSQLSEQSQRIYADALADKQNAESLASQADVAVTEHQKLSDAADQARAIADAASASAQSALAEQETKSNQLIAQLAMLKDSTVEIETAYLQGEQQRKEAEAAAAAAAERAQAEAAAQARAHAEAAAQEAAAQDAAREAASRAAQPAPAPQPAAPRTAPAAPRTAPAAPRTAPAPQRTAPAPQPAPQPQPQPAPQPQQNAVETAISFATAQLGKRYDLGGMGPDLWDCSGLTKAAYASAGIYVGTHSATNQYNRMAAEGKLVPYSQRQRGDLIFWGGGGDYWHVAIYLGNGKILEAADYGKPVRVWSTWGAPVGMVGRPSA